MTPEEEVFHADVKLLLNKIAAVQEQVENKNYWVDMEKHVLSICKLDVTNLLESKLGALEREIERKPAKKEIDKEIQGLMNKIERIDSKLDLTIQLAEKLLSERIDKLGRLYRVKFSDADNMICEFTSWQISEKAALERAREKGAVRIISCKEAKQE